MLSSDCLTIRSRDAGRFCVINCCIDIGLEPLVPPFDFFSRVLSFLPSVFGLSRFFSSFLFSSFGFSFFTSRFGSSFFRGSRFSAFFLLFSLGLFLKNDSIEAYPNPQSICRETCCWNSLSRGNFLPLLSTCPVWPRRYLASHTCKSLKLLDKRRKLRFERLYPTHPKV